MAVSIPDDINNEHNVLVQEVIKLHTENVDLYRQLNIEKAKIDALLSKIEKLEGDNLAIHKNYLFKGIILVTLGFVHLFFKKY